MAISTVAQAHTGDEMAEWFEDWQTEYKISYWEWYTSGEWELSSDMVRSIFAYQQMRDNHPAWDFDEGPVPSTSFVPSKAPHTTQPESVAKLGNNPEPPPIPEPEPPPPPKVESPPTTSPPKSSPPATTAPKPPPPVTAGVEQWRGLVSTFFPHSEIERALCIMGHESNGNPNALNPSSGAAGLFQFIPSTWDNMVPSSLSGGSYASGAPFVPEANVASAAWLQGAEGWTQWSPYKRGLCH